MKKNKTIIFITILVLITLLSSFTLLGCKAKTDKISELEKEAKEANERIKELEDKLSEAETIEDIPDLKTGNNIEAEGIEIFIPPETQDSQPEITVSKVTESLPSPPDGIEVIGSAYELESDGELTGPVLITIPYDPGDLPSDASEENLYIATRIGDSWIPAEGGLIDTENNTVSVSVDHFSIWQILYNPTKPIYDIIGAIQGQTEEINEVAFSNLPQEIQSDLADIQTLDIKSIVSLKLSHLTKLSSALISFSNLVSKTSGLALGVLDGTKQAIYKAVALTIASEAAEYTGSELAGFGLFLYSSYEAGKIAGEYLGGADMDPYTVAANIAAWVLQAEMQYINANMDKAFSDIYKFNPTSFSRLQMYAVFINSSANPSQGIPQRKGVKFYYYDEGNSRWVNYYNNIVTWEIKLEPVETEEKPEGTEKSELIDAEEIPSEEKFVVTVPMTITITPGSSPTLEEAIEGLAADSTIILESGTYYISKQILAEKELNILGVGIDQTEIIGDNYNTPLFLKNGGPFTIEDLTFRHAPIIVESSNININNCRFKDIETALELEGSSTGIIKDCILRDISKGIIVADNSNLRIEGNDIEEYSDAIQIGGNAEVSIEYNTVMNGGYGYGGIQFGDNSRGIVRYNKCMDNASMDAIDIEDYAVVTLEENECYGSSIGISVEGNAVAALVDNKCNNNEVSGITFSGNSSGTVRYNECIENEITGIRIGDSASVVLEYNICMYNEAEGIDFYSNGASEIKYNDCIDNLYGLVIGSIATSVYIEANRLQGNKYDFEDYR